MRPALLLTLLRRESRGQWQRLLVFVASLAVGVAAVTAVSGLSHGIEAAVRSSARELLAADIAVESRRPLPPELDEVLARHPEVRRTSVVEMATIAAVLLDRDAAVLLDDGAASPLHDGATAPLGNGATAGEAGSVGRAASAIGASRLVELKVVDGEYPFYGTLALSPARVLAELLDAQSIVCAPELLAALGLDAAAQGPPAARESGAARDPQAAPSTSVTLLIGGAEFRVAGLVLAEPDKLGIGFTLGPRVFMSAAGLARTQLLGVGATVEHRALLALPDGVAAAAQEALEAELEAVETLQQRLRVETAADAQPSLRRGLSRVDSFLGLVALLSLLIGGIGVAQTVRAWLAGRMLSLAICKCLGLRPRELLLLHLLQTLLLGLAGSLAGVALGVVVLTLLPTVLSGVVPPGALHAWQPAAMARGLGLGLLVTLVASVPPLLSILRVPPLAVLRLSAGLTALRWPARAALALVVLGGVFGTAYLQARRVDRAAVFTLGLLGVTLVLLGAVRLVIALVLRLPRGRLALSLRHGLAALARPDAGTYGGVLGLGLGVLVVVAMVLVQSRLAKELSGTLPRDAPSAFLVDIQKDQWPALQAQLATVGAQHVESVPVITARLASIDGVGVEQIAGQRSGGVVGGGDAGGTGGTGSTGSDAARNSGSGGDGGEGGDGARSRDGADGGDRSRGSREGREGGGRWRGGRGALTREQRLTTMDALPEDNRVIDGALWSLPGVNEVSLEEGYAEDLGVRVGAQLVFDVQGVLIPLRVTSLRTVEWRTFGINFFLVVEPGVLDDAPQMRVATLQLAEGGDQALQGVLAAGFPNVTLLPVREIVKKVGALLERLSSGVRVLGLFTVLSGLAILAGALGAAALARRSQIALLKTLGLTRGGVARMFGIEWLLTGALAGAVGGAGGALLAWAVLTQVMELEAQFPVLLVALLPAVLGAALLTCLAGAVASLRALAVSPLAVLREE